MVDPSRNPHNAPLAARIPWLHAKLNRFHFRPLVVESKMPSWIRLVFSVALLPLAAANPELVPGVYSGGYQYPSRSTDNDVTWEQVKTGLTYSWYTGIIGDGKNIYTGSSNEKQPFFVSPEADGRNWKAFNDQTFSAAPFAMALDPINRILYSASWGEGLLAVKLPAVE